MDLVRITDVADRLGVTKDYALRLAKRFQLELHYGARRAVSVSSADADRLSELWTPRTTQSDSHSGCRNGLGRYYLIQLMPESDTRRLKLGYTDSMPQRLADHRTTCPTLRLIKDWPCHRTWESAVTASLTRTDARSLGGEVYEADPTVLIERGNAIFSLLPDGSD